ncbi:lipid A core-O-antigen ligase-like enyme [Thermanaerovibrio velox DSM 12556]|uniref:Lipid A core-O-antigen ligase-like enyme n=1 Tax=Thermanaerovibrio velox DSM 12556 TaxID=926567 RepID=H0USH6_9BACT|nr:O-antigen ligase family protein [Thermanaerovibrio velox]EHM10265.1 lipid A core-O-antigen ligase-like enyme [Thermanaerovibrio velox DSM 12556]
MTPRVRLSGSLEAGGSASSDLIGASAGGLVPPGLFLLLGGITLGIPNLVFSGFLFYDPLHLLKWIVTMVPVAVLSVVAGWSVMRRGPERSGFMVDTLGCMWLLVILWASVQPLFGGIKSLPTFIREWFALGGLVAFYFVAYNAFRGEGDLRVFLWLAIVNCGLNVVFAEVQTRLSQVPFSFILNAPGNYVGNTAQQEMFGLWSAMACFCGVYLHVSHSEVPPRRRWMEPLNLALLALNGWGFWNSTARGGIVSFIAGVVVLALMVVRNFPARRSVLLRRMGIGVLVMGLMLAATLGAGHMGLSRSQALLNKAADMVENPTSLAGRIGIWRSSWEVFKFHPIKGVGLGQFKLHYLAGQRLMFDRYPDGLWQYTLWAHNEYLQWLAEFGVIGGVLLALAMAWWLRGFFWSLLKGDEVPLYCAWACGMAFIVATDALFSRPFHRVENVIWLAFALAVSARTLLPRESWFNGIRNQWVTRVFGAAWMVVALLGLTYLADGYVGDRMLLLASKMNDPNSKLVYVNKAVSHIMTREEAEEQRGYYFLALGRYLKDPVVFRKGADILYQAFLHRPDTKKLFELINAYGMLRDKDKVMELVYYLKPGTYQLHF